MDTPIHKQIIESQQVIKTSLYLVEFFIIFSQLLDKFLPLFRKKMSKYKLCLLWAEPSRNIQQAVQSASYTMHLSITNLQTAFRCKNMENRKLRQRQRRQIIFLELCEIFSQNNFAGVLLPVHNMDESLLIFLIKQYSKLQNLFQFIYVAI